MGSTLSNEYIHVIQMPKQRLNLIGVYLLIKALGLNLNIVIGYESLSFNYPLDKCNIQIR